ncbi:MAG: acyl-ACP--UDP-N-acetylglucosamine O-acyltransferase [Candidatus Competibacteraceae bacterium]|nr:acyl-ACP--UDP-N-acetylglucosamine O-acyltransferase [Candidatus Competibacteraceae bacterium]
MVKIDPRAVVDGSAQLAPGVEVGAYAIIGPDVEVGQGTRIGPHVVIRGPTRIGRDCRIFQFSSIGDDPQDKKYAGERTWLVIGDRNTIRECCTLNRGTVQDKGETRLGDDNWIMAYVHIAHDCVIGNQTVFANNASLAGHVEVGDYAVMGGFALVHQFCRIGAHSLLSFASGTSQDIPPFVIAQGHRATPHGINAEGLKRRGFSPEEIAGVRRAYKALYREDLKLQDAIQRIREQVRTVPRLAILADFLTVPGRGIIR